MVEPSCRWPCIWNGWPTPPFTAIPDLVFHGFNDLRVTHGVQVDPGATIQLRAFAGKAVKQDKLFVVPVELRGKRKDGREVIHSRGEIVLVSALPAAPPADRPPAVSPLRYPVAQAYREYLFHGPELHGIERIDGTSDTAFIGTRVPGPASGRVVPVAAPIHLGRRPARARRELPDDDPLDARSARHRLAALLRGPVPPVPQDLPDRADDRRHPRSPRRRQVRPRRHRLPRPGRPGHRSDAGLRVRDGEELARPSAGISSSRSDPSNAP